VSRDNSLHCRQTDPGTLKLRISVQPLKRGEKLAGVRHVEPCAVVPNVENGLVSLVLLPEYDLRLWPLRRVLQGVSEQVYEDNRD
jgi:hypothetical protein